MSAARTSLRLTAADLREAFDRSFAVAPALEPPQLENFLAVRVSGDPYAIRSGGILAIHVDRRVAPLPSALPALLGVAGFRGQLMPVYDLAALIGGAARAAPRWLAVARAREAVALAFESFERQWLAEPQELLPDAGEPHTCAHLRGAVRIDGGVRPILNLESVIDELSKRVAAARSTKEA